MKLELKAIKHSEFASQETHCYQANLYLDGKKVAQVGNDGHGGCDYLHPVKTTWQEFQPLFDKINAHFEAMPEYEYKPTGGLKIKGDPIMIQPTLEGWCAEQVTNYLYKKDFKKLVKSKVVGIKNDEVVVWTHKQFKTHKPQVIEMVKKHNPDALILNDLPEDEALEFFMGAA